MSFEVLFLVEDLASASARTRALDLVPGLAKQGITARVEGVARGAIARHRQLGQPRPVVVLARKLLREGDLARLRRATQALVFDLDDALPERPFDVRDRGPSFSRPRRFADALRAADIVVVGSAALRDLVEPHTRVRVLPVAVTIPPNVPGRRSEGDGVSGDPVRLLWTGSRATLGYLERLRTPWLELQRRRPRIRLHVLSDSPSALPDAENERWSLEAEDRALARADIGLMPLADDAWSRGKCGLKLARYLAWGVPSVTSRFGAGLELVEAPWTGLVADDEGEWLLRLDDLVRDPQRRRAIGARGRADAAARLSLDARVAAWAGVLREAMAFRVSL